MKPILLLYFTIRPLFFGGVPIQEIKPKLTLSNYLKASCGIPLSVDWKEARRLIKYSDKIKARIKYLDKTR
jgi:hypothetical protein